MALCPHFGECGGCRFQDLPYEDQLRKKELKVQEALAGIDLPSLEMHPSPSIWFYRNKMEFSFSDVYPPEEGGPTLSLGLKARGRWYKTLDLSECRLLSPETPALLSAVRRWAAESGAAPYNSVRREGFLRNLIVREAKNGAERMVYLVTAPGEMDAPSFVGAVKVAYPATTVLRGVNAAVSEAVSAGTIEVLDGPGTIVETLRLKGREISLRVSPLSFFQTNTGGAEVLYGLIREWTREIAPARVLDLYCGGGGIGLSVADLCGKVLGSESNASATADGAVNAGLNGAANISFYEGPVEIMLPALLDFRPQLVIADPPRAGVGKKVCRLIKEEGPEFLIYVSCGPAALAQDLKTLLESYEIDRLAAVDLFPHTEHVETLARLVRRKKRQRDCP